MQVDKMSDRRMKRAEIIQANCPTLCWIDICMWAMFRHNTITLNGAEKCKQESRDTGSCYCERFKGGLDCDRLVEVDDAD